MLEAAFFWLFGGLRALGAAESEAVVQQRQLWWMLWKSWQGRARARKATALYFALPLVVLLLLYLLYASFASPAGRSSGLMEAFLAPLAFVVVLQSTTVALVTDKSLRLVEALRMTGLREAPYWGGLVLFDGVGMGLCLSFALSVFAAITGLFHADATMMGTYHKFTTRGGATVAISDHHWLFVNGVEADPAKGSHANGVFKEYLWSI